MNLKRYDIQEIGCEESEEGWWVLHDDVEKMIAELKRDTAYELAAKWPPTSVMNSRLRELGDKFVEGEKK